MDEEIRRKILTLLDQHRIMTIATLRPDGWPQATTVGYANEGLTLYFLCGPESQKAANLARDERVSLTGLTISAITLRFTISVAKDFAQIADDDLERIFRYVGLSPHLVP